MEPLPLSASGRPELLPDETEVFTVAGVTLASNTAPLLVRLSNFRLMLQSEGKSSTNSNFHIHLQTISSVEAPKSSFLWTRNNVKLMVYESVLVELLFTQHRDVFVTHLQKQLEKKSWINKALMTTKKPQGFDPSKAGVSGLMKAAEDKQKDADQNLAEAFKDMDAMMQKAEELVQLANRLGTKLESRSASSSPNHDQEKEAAAAFHSDIMQKMGIWSPVTRDNTGGTELYYQELARELADFVIKRGVLRNSNPISVGHAVSPVDATDEDLKIRKDVITMADLYCIFNRARGSELISPDDLMHACRRFETLGLPIRVQRFENSGVNYVTTDSYDDKTIYMRVAALLQRRGPLTAAQLAAGQGISLPLAQHYMQKAEESGLLCRDESSEGLIFYPNIFLRKFS